MADGKLIYDVVANVAGLDKDLTNAEKEASSKLGKLESAGKKVGKAVGASFLAIGTAAVSVGSIAVNSAYDLDKAMNQFSASTGIAKEDLDSYEETLKNIYTNNYGESFEDIAEKMGLITQQIDGLDQASLQNLTEGLYTLEDTFGADFNETLRGADQLMTQFGLSSEEALDLLAAGSQAGLDYTSELGDNIAEYAGKFSQAGYSAEEYFQLLANGADGGAYNLDKINDSINEVTTRLADGTIGDAIGSFSSETQNLFEQWQNGGATQKEVIDSIVKDISTCTNEQEALTMAATAFGSMGEDANLDFIKSLSAVGDEFENTKGAMEGLKEVKYDDLGSMIQGLGRALETTLIPLGEALIPIIKDVFDALSPIIEQLLNQLSPAVEMIAELLKPVFEDILPIILDLFNELLDPVQNLASELLPVFAEVWEMVAEPLQDVIDNIMPYLTEAFSLLVDSVGSLASSILPILGEMLATMIEIIGPIIEQLLPILLELLKNILDPVMELVQALLPSFLELFQAIVEPIGELVESLLPILNSLLEALTPLIDVVLQALQPVFELFVMIASFLAETLFPVLETLAQIFGELLVNAIELIEPIIENVITVFSNLIDFIVNVFSGDWSAAWDNIVNIFKSILNVIPRFVESMINGVIDLLNGLLGGIEWAADLVGWDISLRIPHVSLPRFHTGGVVDIDANEGAALLQDGEMVLTQHQQAELFAIANGEAASSSRPLMADITLSGDVQMDGFKVGKVVLRNLDDVAAFTLRG